MKKNLKYYTIYMVVGMVILAFIPDMSAEFHNLENWIMKLISNSNAMLYAQFFSIIIVLLSILYMLSKVKK